MEYALRVNDLYACVQGEGCQTGVPMVLLRLHGCMVGCPWCDTKETWRVDEQHRAPTLDAALGTSPAWYSIMAAALVEQIVQRYPQHEWVLLSGGEPTEQDCQPLIRALTRYGRRVAVETSGTGEHVQALLHPLRVAWLTLSPKLGMPGKRLLRAEIVQHANEIKWPVGRQQDIDDLEAFLALHGVGADQTVCVQPISQSRRATDLCLAVLDREHPEWRLSVQTHKYLALR
jgi:7-carboxy-7-deazaguanine synthase